MFSLFRKKSKDETLDQIMREQFLKLEEARQKSEAENTERLQKFFVAWQQHDIVQREKDRENLKAIPLEAINHLKRHEKQETVARKEEIQKNKKKAAIALNLCMVSLSQIVDYNDINILKLEYEAILNNINMENIIKDEALLDALKKILDTCHFYLLHEKDKEFLKKRQAHRLKNEIGKALQNKGGIIAIFGNPNPFAIVATAALMVGVAAVNYKTQKAQAAFENEEEEWKLQRTALEQLHNLRNTLFETAWRLADTYEFEDRLRLTEKQITLYNEILADPDPLNRYERLEAISDQFEAYPLFFYYKGRAALEAAKEEEKNPKSSELYLRLLNQAKTALTQFSMVYKDNQLLREDIVAASAYLDLAALSTDGREKFKEHIDHAINLAGWNFDILQNCAFRYMQLTKDDNDEEINDNIAKEAKEKAIRILKILVNENHNMSINARLLSRLYIETNNKDGYSILERCLSEKYSFPYRHIRPWDLSIDYRETIHEYFIGTSSKLPEVHKVLFKYFEGHIRLLFDDLLKAIPEAKRIGNTAPIKYFSDKHPRLEMTNKLHDILLHLPDNIACLDFPQLLELSHDQENIFLNATINLLNASKKKTWYSLCLNEEKIDFKNAKDDLKNFELLCKEFDHELIELSRKYSFVYTNLLKSALSSDKMLAEPLLEMVDCWEEDNLECRKKLRMNCNGFNFANEK